MLHCKKMKRLFHECYNKVLLDEEKEKQKLSRTVQEEILFESKKYNCILLSKEIRKYCKDDNNISSILSDD
jgi:hypothetical protein